MWNDLYKMPYQKDHVVHQYNLTISLIELRFQVIIQ